MNSLILTPQQIQSIDCGIGQTYFMPADFPLSESEALKKLTTKEIEQSTSFKNDQRRVEFIRSRWLLRTKHGIQAEVLRAGSGEPEVSDGSQIVSMSHCKGHVVATSARKDQARSLGIDIEVADRVPTHLQEKIASSGEVATVQKATGYTEQQSLSLIFSGKEAVFKAVFPLGRKVFYFQGAYIDSVDLHKQSIRGTYMEDTSLLTPKGAHFVIEWRALGVGEKQLFLTKVSLEP